MFIIPPLRRSKKCTRCGLRYPARYENCAHCTGLDEQQLQRLHEKREREHQAHQGLYMQMMIVAGILLVITVFLASS